MPDGADSAGPGATLVLGAVGGDDVAGGATADGVDGVWAGVPTGVTMSADGAVGFGDAVSVVSAEGAGTGAGAEPLADAVADTVAEGEPEADAVAEAEAEAEPEADADADADAEAEPVTAVEPAAVGAGLDKTSESAGDCVGFGDAEGVPAAFAAWPENTTRNDTIADIRRKRAIPLFRLFRGTRIRLFQTAISSTNSA